jgi:hypothetical protein
LSIPRLAVTSPGYVRNDPTGARHQNVLPAFHADIGVSTSDGQHPPLFAVEESETLRAPGS